MTSSVPGPAIPDYDPNCPTRRANDGHWLVMDDDRKITGCHCGFVADPNDVGFGDSVLRHFRAVIEAEVRERIASEIEARNPKEDLFAPGWNRALRWAASVARGAATETKEQRDA